MQSVNKGMKEILDKPPGRRPREIDIQLSELNSSLDEHAKSNVDMIIEQSVYFSVFQFLGVLDGVVAIEHRDKGALKLFYQRGANKILLNDSNEIDLHDLTTAQQ